MSEISYDSWTESTHITIVNTKCVFLDKYSYLLLPESASNKTTLVLNAQATGVNFARDSVFAPIAGGTKFRPLFIKFVNQTHYKTNSVSYSDHYKTFHLVKVTYISANRTGSRNVD